MDGGDYKPDDVHAVNVFSEAARVPNTSRTHDADADRYNILRERDMYAYM